MTELQAAVGSCDAGDALAVSSAVGAKVREWEVVLDVGSDELI